MGPKMEVFEKVKNCCWCEVSCKIIVHPVCWLVGRLAAKLKFYVGSYILNCYRIRIRRLANLPACMTQPLFPDYLLCRWRENGKGKSIKGVEFDTPYICTDTMIEWEQDPVARTEYVCMYICTYDVF